MYCRCSRVWSISGPRHIKAYPCRWFTAVGIESTIHSFPTPQLPIVIFQTNASEAVRYTIMASYPYWGIHTSLYRSLPVESIRSIERAIWLKMTGRANDARAVFDHELKSSTKFPVVTIEYADLELEAGRWGRAWRMLDSALANATEANDDLDAPEYRLMALTRAMLGTRHRGDLVSSVQEIKRSHSWLLNVPVAEYTDIQVRFASPPMGESSILT